MSLQNIRLIELCSGIGAQSKGLQNTGLFNIESVATADLDKEVVVSYAAIHCGLTNEVIESYKDYPSKEEMVKELTEKRLGYDFKNDKPYDWAKLSKRKSKVKGIERYWLADKLSKNLGDMMKIKELPDCDFLTYSCPCTDISVSGKQEGLKWTCKDCGHEYDPASMTVEERYTCPSCGSHNIKSTRSGLLYEVERLLVKAKENGNLPTYLLMENVDALVSKKYIDSFIDWIDRLDNLGYSSFYQVINAKNAGIPQNRKRIFVLSILKEKDTGLFTFPTPFDTGLRLKDVLESDVDEHYYLPNEKVAKFLENFKVSAKISESNQCIQVGNYYANSENFKNKQCGRVYSSEGCCPTLNTCGGGDHEPKIIQVGNISSSQDGIVVDPEGISKTLTAGHFNCPKIVTCVDKSNNCPREIDLANCITTREDRGVSNHKQEGTAVIERVGNVNPSGKGMNGNVFSENGLSPALTTNKGEGVKVAVAEQISECSYELNGYPLVPDNEGHVQTIVAMRGRNPENPSDRTVGAPTEQRLEVNTTGASNCITTVQKDNLLLEGELPIRSSKDESAGILQIPRGFNKGGVLDTCPTISSNSWEQNNFLYHADSPWIRIRKLTPKECHRLMGFDDEDYDRCKAVGCSDSQGYKQAGNSIVVNVIELIAEHLYKAQYNNGYECTDEKIINFQNPQRD